MSSHAPGCPVQAQADSDGITERLAHIPDMLRQLADALEAQHAAPVDLCFVVMSTPQSDGPPFVVHSFGRRPSTMEARGLLFSAATRVPDAR